MHGTDTGMGDGPQCRAAELVGTVSSTPDTRRSVASSSILLRNCPANPRETNPETTTKPEAQPESSVEILGSRVQDSDLHGSPESETPTFQGKLGLRAQVESNCLADESEEHGQWCDLRPSEVVRLLNSTPLGSVINDRQLYRHRQKAPWIQTSRRRIDFMSYMAWLVARRRHHTRRKRRVTGRETLSLNDLRELLRQQKFRCALSGEILTPTNFALDHIIPIANGGEFTVTNSQLVLKTVNRAKNTMNEQEFIEMCRKVATHRQDHPAAQAAPSGVTELPSGE